jgi:uncharacterized protein (DUF433 family)
VTAAKKLYGGADPRDLPSYTVPFAASLVGVPASTLRAWVLGRKYPTKDGPRQAKRIIHPADVGFLSFTNLIEAHVLSAMRKDYQLKLDVVRRAVGYVETELEVEHPLAREEFRTDGVHLFVERFGKLVNASADGQLAIRKALDTRLDRIDYANRRADRLFPLLRTSELATSQPRLVVIDPRRGFGRPILADKGILVSVIKERFQAGEPCSRLAKDYKVRVEAIEEAVRAA